jgi:signal transduction histidine kinase/ActR/RegA family two-component response regulator
MMVAPSAGHLYAEAVSGKQRMMLLTDDSMKSTALLKLRKTEHQQAFNNFRMDESSLRLQVFITGLRVISIPRELMNTVWVIVPRVIAIACMFWYTLYLANHKKAISCSWLVEKQNPIYVCNIGMLTSMISTAIQLLLLSAAREEGDEFPVYEAILILSQIVLARIFFRMGDWWAEAAVGFIGGGCLAVAAVLFDQELTVILLSIFTSVMVILLAYEHDMNKLNLFLNYSNLEYAIRTAYETESKKELAEKLSLELRAFIGNVAHDLKTPLQAFVSELDTLSAAKDMRGRDSSVKDLKGTCNFMSMMINRSLDFVKSESGVPLVATMSTVDLKESLDWVTNCIRRVSDKVPLRVFDMASDLCRFIITDKQWLDENLLCLTSNAIKFTTTGSIDISISVVTPEYIQGMKDDDSSKLVVEFSSGRTNPSADNQARPVSGQMPFTRVRISPSASQSTLMGMDGTFPSSEGQGGGILLFEIEDTGIGLTAEQRGFLFKPFQQAQRKAGGTGLGLYALAKRIEAAGGHYGVKGRHDGRTGSLFWFSVPYRPDMMAASLVLDEPNESPDSLILTRTPGTSYDDVYETEDLSGLLKVLLVDDAPLIQKTTRRALEREGYYVVVASQGVECLHILGSSMLDFEVVLLDMQMPVMDGLETIRRIRDIEAKQGLGEGATQFVIGVSAYSDSETRDAAISAGMNDFITKPLSMAAMKQCCQKHGINISSSK